jgi:hypothetical protein
MADDPTWYRLATLCATISIPVVVVVMTNKYQDASHNQDARRARFDQTFNDVKTITDMLGQWQANYEALQIDCEPDHLNDNDKCLSDYTRRLRKIDAYVAQIKWAVSVSPVGAITYKRVTDFENEWWSTTRHALDSTFGHLAVRKDTKAPLTTADTTYDDYNRLVSRCEQNWADPACPSLRQCQQHGFEHSECVKEIGDKLETLDALSLSAFCAADFSLNFTRIKALEELQAPDAGVADLFTQLCAPGRCAKTLQDHPDFAKICAPRPEDAGKETSDGRATVE